MVRCFSPAKWALALLIFASGAAFSQTPASPNPAPQQPPPRRGFAGAGGDYKHYSAEALDNGKRFYTANCAFCHGGNAKGGESGPDLLRSVVVLHDEDGETLGAFISVGIPNKGMPKFSLPQDQVNDIASFLHERVRQAAERGGYQILNIVVGNATQGQTYFNGMGGCVSCHSVDKDLAHIGSKYQPVDLQQKIIMPRDQRSSGNGATALQVKITQPSGEILQGALYRMDDFSVTFDDHGDRKTIQRENEDVPKVEVTDPLKGHMQLLTRYTDSDIHNLTAYLLTLK